MSTTTTTHLNFHGDARAALEFYKTVFTRRRGAPASGCSPTRSA